MYVSRYRFSPEDPMGSGLITCNVDNSLKSGRWVEGREWEGSEVTDSKVKDTGSHV